jgi:hypothetical protein
MRPEIIPHQTDGAFMLTMSTSVGSWSPNARATDACQGSSQAENMYWRWENHSRSRPSSHLRVLNGSNSSIAVADSPILRAVKTPSFDAGRSMIQVRMSQIRGQPPSAEFSRDRYSALDGHEEQNRAYMPSWRAPKDGSSLSG